MAVPASNLARGFAPPETLEDETPSVDGLSGDDAPSVIIVEEGEGEGTPELGDDGVLTIANGDGTVVIDFDPDTPANDSADADIETNFDANLAKYIDDNAERELVSTLLADIESDDRSREEWLQNRAKGYDMLGFKLEEPRADVGGSTAPFEGMSTVRHTLLPEAVIRFQSNATAELLPAAGPVKVRNDSPSTPSGGDAPPAALPTDPPTTLPPETDNDDLAQALEKDFNHYLTVNDKGYRADTDRMLFLVGFGGAGFKKVYHDPIRRMPLSRSVDAADLIVSNEAHDIEDAARVTHRIMMRYSTLKRNEIAGLYRDVEGISAANQQFNAIDQKIAAIQGVNLNSARPEDNLHTIYETYLELDLAGFEHKDEDGNPTGLPLPYRVTIEKDSQRLLEIRRNWRKDDQNCLPKRVFVKFPFVPAFGFYEIGFLHILGNATRALTAAWREMLDSGMFANFPGFLYALQQAGRQITNEFRIPPGGGVGIQTGGKPISDIVMRLPYNDVTPGLSSLVEKIEATVQRLAGTAELAVGEGKQDMPVGTTLALLEQATKILAAVHIRLHAAQSEEFQLLKDLFREDPEAFWRNNPRPAKQWQKDEFLAALENCDVVPAADPNTPSNAHRIMKAVAMKQLQAANPQLYDAKKLDARIMRMLNIADPESLFNTNPQPPQDPSAGQAAAKMAEIQSKEKLATMEAQQHQQDQAADAQQDQQQAADRAATTHVESADRAADRASRERVATTREITERIKELSNMAQKGLIDPAMAVAGIMATINNGQVQPPAPAPAAPYSAAMAPYHGPVGRVL